MSPKLTFWHKQYSLPSSPSPPSSSPMSSSPSASLRGGGVLISSSADPDSASLSSLSFVDDGEFFLPLFLRWVRPDFLGCFRMAAFCLLPCGAVFLMATCDDLAPALPALALTGVPPRGVPGRFEAWRPSPLVGGTTPPVSFSRLLALFAPKDISRCVRPAMIAEAGVAGAEEDIAAVCEAWR